MPSRKRQKPRAAVETHDPIQRFAAALQESDAQARADRERARVQREAAEAEARAASERAAALDAARRDLERAIERARAARRNGSGVPAADEAWRAAKARVIELETGAPPEWAHDTAGDDPGHDSDGVDERGEGVDERGDERGDDPPVDAT